MIQKKYIILLVVLFVFAFSFYFLSKDLVSELDIHLGMFSITGNVERVTDINSAAKKSLVDNKLTLFDLKNKNTCYWFRSTRNQTHFILEINEYEYTPEMKGCFGNPKTVKYITFDKPINIRGINCLCDVDTYSFEWKDSGLKISKQVSIQRTLSLDITEWIQNLLKDFTKK